jgi:hypothetical protein
MKMKKNIIWFLLLAPFLFQSCEDDPEIGEPFGKIEGLTATSWVLDRIYLVDEGNPSKPEIEISEFIKAGNSLPTIRFESDFSFESSSGDSPIELFPESGTWSFNNNDTPSSITLISPDRVVDSPLGGPTRISDSELRLNIPKFCNVDGEDVAVLGYRVVYIRN